jgi:HNH endonuclease
MGGEIWAQIADLPDYAVSTNGKLMRITDGVNTTAGRMLTPAASRQGYLRVCLQQGERQVNKSVHRLVALNHIPNPDEKPQVNHKDGKRKWDNSVTNLEWATRSENMRHADQTGLRVVAKGSSHYAACFTEQQVAEIRFRYANEGATQSQLANEFGVCREVIRDMVKGKTWKHVPLYSLRSYFPGRPATASRPTASSPTHR